MTDIRQMWQRVRTRPWTGGTAVGISVAGALNRFHYERAFVAVFCATVVWFLVGLARDNLVFRKEVAEQKQRLAERRAAVRAAKLEAAQRARNEPRS